MKTKFADKNREITSILYQFFGKRVNIIGKRVNISRIKYIGIIHENTMRSVTFRPQFLLQFYSVN